VGAGFSDKITLKQNDQRCCGCDNIKEIERRRVGEMSGG
jgi:hypothetical protein